MMLPIMLGLEMALSVGRLEQGELYLSDLGSVQERWAVKEQELKEQLLIMPAMPVGNVPTCPAAPEGFVQSSMGCSFIEVNPARNFVARIYQSDMGWSACFVSKAPENPDLKCSDEV